MHTNLVYQVRLGGKARLFPETASGALDYEGLCNEAEADRRSEEAIGYPIGPLVGELRRIRDYEDDLYLAEKKRAAVFLAGESPCCGPRSSPEIAAFFKRYPELEEAMAWGDMNLASLLARRSRKLAPFRRLLGAIFGERWGLAFALAWLGEGANEARFDALLRGPSEPDPAFELALPYVESTSGQDYRIEASNLLASHLESGERIVLPIVGAAYRPCLGKLAALIAEARSKARLAAILEADGAGAATAEERIDTYLAATTVFLEREPYNHADRNALAVLLQFPDRPELEHGGYVKREIAALLAPYVAADSTGYEAELFRLGDGSADIRIGLRVAGEKELPKGETDI